MPFKYDNSSNTFIQKGETQAFRIVAGLEGSAMLKGFSEDRLYGWWKGEGIWKPVEEGRVINGVFGKAERMYKISSYRAF